MDAPRSSSPVTTGRCPDLTTSRLEFASVLAAPVPLRRPNLFGRDAAQIFRDAHRRKKPDDPLGRIEVPRLYAIPVVMLELVVVVMISLAESDERHEE